MLLPRRLVSLQSFGEALPARHINGFQKVQLLLCTLTLLCTFSIAQTGAPPVQWDQTYGGSKVDKLYSVQQTTNGGYILCGSSESPADGNKSTGAKGGNDYWVIKLDAAGNKEWEKTLGGNDNDYGYAVQQTSDGGYIVGGHSAGGVNGDKTEASRGSHDYWVVKLDAAGNKMWDKTYGGNGWDELHAMQQTSDGGYMLGGHSFSNASGDKTENRIGVNYADYWVVKLDADGNKEWDKTIGGTGGEDLHAIQQTSDGGYLLGGSSFSGIGYDKSEANLEETIFGW